MASLLEFAFCSHWRLEEIRPKHVATKLPEQQHSGCSKQSLTLQARRAHWRAGHELRRGCGALPTTGFIGHCKRHARNSKCDFTTVEDLLTCKTGVDADRPQSSGSTGSGSASRAPAQIEGSLLLPGLLCISIEDAPAPEQRPDL